MPEIAIPQCTVSGFSFRVDDRGRVIYPSAYSGNDFVVGPGRSRLAGTITFAPHDDVEESALQGFLFDLDGDSNDYVMLPWRRDPRDGAEGVFPSGTKLTVTSVADSGTDETSMAFTFELPADATADQVQAHVGAVMTLNGVLVRFRTVAVAGTSVSGTVFPRVASASPNVLTEGVVKARVQASAQLMARRGKLPQEVTLPWVQID